MNYSILSYAKRSRLLIPHTGIEITLKLTAHVLHFVALFTSTSFSCDNTQDKRNLW